MKRLTQQQSERLMAGFRASEPGHDDLADFLSAAKRLLAQAPDDDTAAAHLSAIAQVAARPESRSTGTSPFERWRKVVKRTTAFALKTGLATAVLAFGMVGLAYAGVDLPGTASERAFEAVLGVELPNQATEDDDKSKEAKEKKEKKDKKAKKDKDEVAADKDANEGGGKSVSDAVHAVQDGTDERGCEYGQAVAEAARANSQNEDAGAEDPCDRDDDKTRGKSDDAHGKSDEDHGKAGEAHGKSDDDHGKAGAKNTTEDELEEDELEDDKEPNGSRETGEEASEKGRSNRPTDDDE